MSLAQREDADIFRIMAEPFLGEIRMVGFNFAPTGWSTCDGQVMSIAQNTALFALLGTTYGGDGRSTFALPDLRGRFPMHFGASPGLTPRQQGESAGTESVTLTTAQLAAHSHPSTLPVSNDVATLATPANNVLARAADGENTYGAAAGTGTMACTAGNSGGNQAHDNMPPYLVVNFIIALQGIFPPRG